MKSKVERKVTKKPREIGNIFGISFVSTQRASLTNYLLSSVRKGKKLSVVTPNPEILVASKRDSLLKEALLTADIRIPDGDGIGFFVPIETIKGRDLFVDLLTAANEQKLKVFFLGSSEKTISLLKTKVRDTFPHLSFIAESGPRLSYDASPVSRVDRKKSDEVVSKIQKQRPHILFVAFGAPKQEKWIANHRFLPVSIQMAVGGSFDSFVTPSLRPPRVFTSFRLEWLWRLIREPRRFGRIITAVLVFPVLVVFDKLRQRA